MKAKFGDVVSPYAIEKLTMAKNQKVIVGILSTSIVIVKTHFIPELGYLHCFEGKCCQDHGLPAVRYGLPIAVYQTDGDLTITGDKTEYDKMLVEGSAGYKGLLTKHQILQAQGSDITKRDILITCTDDKYQKKTYDILGESHWRKSLSKEEYAEHVKFFIANAEGTFGRRVDENQYLALMETMTSGPVQDRPTAGVKTKTSTAVAVKSRTAMDAAKPSESAPVVDVGDLDFDSLVD